MRNVALALVCLSATAASTTAQGVVSQPLPWGQKLLFGVTSHDFGTIPYGAQLKHRFKMKNIYAVPLDVGKIRSTCGCLSGTPSTTSLKPHEEGYIDVVMGVRPFKGPKSITMFVPFSSPAGDFASTASILFTANARADVVFNPGQVDFNVVPQGQSVVQALDVEYAGSQDWRILEVVKNADAPFTVEPRETYRRTTGLINKVNTVGYQIAVTLKPSAAPGRFRQELILKTNDPISPVMTVVVEGNVQAALSVVPDVVALGPIKLGTSKAQRVLVRGNRPFKVLGIDGGGTAITAALPGAAAASHFLTLQCRPDQAGEWRKQLTIRTDLDGRATATVTVEASVQP
jgi:hypothetical protein